MPGKLTMQTSEDEIELTWLPSVKLLPLTTYTVTLSGRSMSEMELCHSGELYGSRFCGKLVNSDYQYCFTTESTDFIALKVLFGERTKRVSLRPGCIRTLREEVQRRVGCGTELKGSIGEGPNHSNYSDQSSVRILSELRRFR